MINKGWLYGLMVFLAQTCNPYYSANDTRNYYEEEEPIFEEHMVEEEPIYIPSDAFEIDEAIEVEPPRNRNRVMEEPPPPPPPPPAPMPEQEQIYVVVEDMPRFPGCEDQGLIRTERKKCSDMKMIEFISKNIVYPEIAKTNKIEGRVIIKFMVERNGSISKVQVLRDPGGGCGKEAERVVNMMPKWRPGIQRGKPVKVWFTLPISFNLPKVETKSKN